MSVRGVNAISVRYAAAITATNVRYPTMGSLGEDESKDQPDTADSIRPAPSVGKAP